jgi:hypothetical protein
MRRESFNRCAISMNLNRRGILLALAIVALRASTFAYGPVGHEIVGAIADERLAHTAEAAKVNALLDGLTLEKAAVIADEIKGWDKNGVDDSIIRRIETLTGNCAISGKQISRRTR